MASDQDFFQSPVSPNAPQVRSPSPATARLEGETMGPSYGSLDAAQDSVANGVVRAGEAHVTTSVVAERSSSGGEAFTATGQCGVVSWYVWVRTWHGA